MFETIKKTIKNVYVWGPENTSKCSKMGVGTCKRVVGVENGWRRFVMGGGGRR
jgi:hypothetical protein